MPAAVESHDDWSTIVRQLFLSIFRSMVEDGAIEIGDRSAADIIADFKRLAKPDPAQYPEADEYEWMPQIDYRETILKKAREEAEGGENLISLMHYSTWFEHFINGMLSTAFTRRGIPEKQGKLLLRELRIPTKATALWLLLDLPAIEGEVLVTIDQVAAVRNGFVHYKWNAMSEAESVRIQATNSELAERASAAVEHLLHLDSITHWFGREEELVHAFDAHVVASGITEVPLASLLRDRSNDPPKPSAAG